MCGATDQQKELESQQAAFYAQMTQQYSQIFSEQQGILSSLTKTFEPILEKGPDQEGFGPEEKAALEAENKIGVATNFSNAEKALGERQGAMGGGDDFTPTGAREAEQAELSGRAATVESENEESITAADYAQGRSNFQFATGALSTAAGMENPASFAGATTGAGSAAASTANEIAQADNSIVNGVLGAVGGVAGAALGEGGLASGHH